MPLKKWPEEIRTITFDFSDKLDANEMLIPIATATADPGFTVMAVTLVVAAAQVLVRIAAGVSGQDYVLAVKCPTSAGERLEKAITVEVRAE